MNINQHIKNDFINQIYEAYITELKTSAPDYIKLRNRSRIFAVISVVFATLTALSVIITFTLLPILYIASWALLISMLVTTVIMLCFNHKNKKSSNTHLQEELAAVRKIIKKDDKIYDLLYTESNINLFHYLKSFSLKIIAVITFIIGIMIPIFESTDISIKQNIEDFINNFSKDDFSGYASQIIFTIFIVIVILIGFYLLVNAYNLLLSIVKLTTYSKSNELIKLYILAYDSPLINSSSNTTP